MTVPSTRQRSSRTLQPGRLVTGGVEGANYAPLISGTPAGSVLTDESYNFQPAASDADGDTLAFSITGKPAWATFDTTTGRLSGTPAVIDVGTYGNIVISVTDGDGYGHPGRIQHPGQRMCADWVVSA